MSDLTAIEPAQAVSHDAAAAKAPDARRHYSSPEDLAEDIDLDIATRQDLLSQWKRDLDQRLEAESEGMGASDPMAHEQEAKLANEHRRVSNALEALVPKDPAPLRCAESE
ncbi:hypothetical protein KRR38_12240 [Novosphingobium sp. G106]|uniref:hypothetical protein n=1 Tax=Novosphingobium sp. G106 TaxID=2849500 RepID=UPI001C2DA2AB|nr:hypothetical protein [Novosphingobium sp. G106]MBV1688423.1 hypothetical protein [Novosphingobium sp. G106]